MEIQECQELGSDRQNDGGVTKINRVCICGFLTSVCHSFVHQRSCWNHFNLPLMLVEFPPPVACSIFFRMRSKGPRFTRGVWGLKVCSLEVAFASATIRNHSQPFATVRNRSQPFATVRNRPRKVAMAVPLASSANSGHFWRFQMSRSLVSPGTWHSQRVESRFVWQAQYLCKVFKTWLAFFRGRHSALETSIIILRGRGSTCRVARFARIAMSGLRQVVTTCKLRSRRGKLWECHFAWQAVRGMSFCVRRAIWDTPHFTLHTLHSTLYTPHFAAHTPHSTLHNPHSTLHALHSALYTSRFTLGTPHSTLYTPHSTLPTPHSTLYASHSTLHTLPSTLYTLHSLTLYTLHFTLDTWHAILHTLDSTLYTPHFTLHTLRSTLHTPHFTLHTPHCTLYTPHSTLYSLHSTLYTPHSTLDTLTPLYTVHFVLYTPHYTLHFTICTWHSTLHTLHSTL